MANDFDSTAVNSTVKELWDDQIEEARYATGVIFPRVANRSSVAVKKGDVVHVTIDQPFTVGTVGSDGTFTPQNYALATVDVTLANWEQVAIRVLDRAQAQAFWTPESTFPKQVGKAWGSKYDSVLAGLHGSVAAANNIGSIVTPSEFDLTLAREAMLKLADANVPLEDLSWALAPSAVWNGIMAEAQIVDADKSGNGTGMNTAGFTKRQLLGAPMYVTSNIVRTGSPAVRKNLLLHRQGMAIAWQKDGEIDRARGTAAGVLGDILVSQSLYGYNVIRSDHFVVINSKA